MRLLITRPEPDSTETADKLRALGHDALVQPLLNITFAPPPNDLPTPAALLITSKNAVRAIASWPPTSALLQTPAFAAGPATVRAAAALGFIDVRGGARDSGSLVDIVCNTMAPGAGPLLYPAARDRTGGLAAGLTESGYDVRIVEAYRADPVTQFDEAVRAALISGSIDAVLLYSRRTAATFRDLAATAGITGKFAKVAFYVISEQVAEALAGIPGRVQVAEYPDEDSLLARIPSPTRGNS